MLITPGGERIIESMAIFTHLVEAFPGLAPAPGDPARDRMWQHLAVMGTSLYPSMHRIHHTYYYGPDEAHDAIRDFALADMDRWLNYLETQLDPYLAGAAPMAAGFLSVHDYPLGTGQGSRPFRAPKNCGIHRSDALPSGR